MTVAAADAQLSLDGPITLERLKAWNHAYVSSNIAESVWFPESLAAFRGRFQRRRLMDLVFVDVEADPFGIRFESGSPATRYIGVSVNTASFRERVVLGDRREFVLSSDIDVWDAGTLVESEILSPMAQTVLLVPKTALHISGCASIMLREELEDGDRASLRLLRSMVLDVASVVDRLGAAAAVAARNSIVELLMSVVQDRCQPSKAAVSASMRMTVTRWVDEHLHLGQLPPSLAAEHHGISVRSLHRLFEDSGESYGALVRQSRLERARRDLLSTDGMVQSIAMHWGYADASQFINEFKRAYRTTPAAYRKANRSRIADADALRERPGALV